MAKPNYSFEKRQRELAKKKKKEEKAANKAALKAAGGEEMNPNDAAMALLRDEGNEGDDSGDAAGDGDAPESDAAGGVGTQPRG